jgi:hypothetical protein
VIRDDSGVRRALDIDDDVLQAAKKLAAQRKTTAGKVLPELARQAIEPTGRQTVRNGVPLLARPRRGSPKATRQLVNRLRD